MAGTRTPASCHSIPQNRGYPSWYRWSCSDYGVVLHNSLKLKEAVLQIPRLQSLAFKCATNSACCATVCGARWRVGTLYPAF
jgi:hypothetical protein